MANYKDHGTYYADQSMVHNNLALCIDSGILYDIENANNVTRVSMLLPTHPFIARAKENIKADAACWYGVATIMTGNNNLIWEY